MSETDDGNAPNFPWLEFGTDWDGGPAPSTIVQYAEGGTTYQQLAEEFSISKPAIVRIMSNNPACRTWKHVR